jgi:hypothetical protein
VPSGVRPSYSVLHLQYTRRTSTFTSTSDVSHPPASLSIQIRIRIRILCPSTLPFRSPLLRPSVCLSAAAVACTGSGSGSVSAFFCYRRLLLFAFCFSFLEYSLICYPNPRCPTCLLDQIFSPSLCIESESEIRPTSNTPCLPAVHASVRPDSRKSRRPRSPPLPARTVLRPESQSPAHFPAWGVSYASVSYYVAPAMCIPTYSCAPPEPRAYDHNLSESV